MLSDGGATRGPLQNGKIAAWYASAWKQLPETQRPRTYMLAVGDDANLPLLRMLARQDGVLEHVLSTEPMEFKLNSFLSKIGRSPIGQLALSVSPESAVDTVYPLQAATFSGSLASWVGRYQKPQENVSFTVHGVRDGAALRMDGQNQSCPQNHSITRNCRACGRAPASTLCSKRSSVKAKTRRPSTKSSALHANTSSSPPTLRSWLCPGRCSVPASFAPATRSSA
jgi:hypothetical protein